MAKNITIAEGGSAKTFTAKKIKTKLTDGGTQNWIPEDEAADYVKLKEKTIKANGTYDAEDDNADGYSRVTVDIPSKVKEKTFTANGDYSAADDDVMGYSRVKVSVPQQGIPGPYKVNFFAIDRETLLETVDNVEYGGGAIYHGPTPTTSGMRFVGWSPNPQYITGNTNCYPRFENIVYSEEQITDDWVTIAKNCRRDPDAYEIGQWKMLEFERLSYNTIVSEGFVNAVWPRNSNYSFQQSASRCRLIAKGVDRREGENGYANTTWMIENLIFNGMSGASMGINEQYNYDGEPSNSMTQIYGEKLFRFFLEQCWFNHCFPEELRDYLLPVIKTSFGYPYATSTTSVRDNKSIDYLWPFSFREMFGNCNSSQATGNWVYMFAKMEQEGPIYEYFFEEGSAPNGKSFTNFNATTTSAVPLRSMAWNKGYGVMSNCASFANQQKHDYILGFCM